MNNSFLRAEDSFFKSWTSIGFGRPLYISQCPRAALTYCVDFFVWRWWQRILGRAFVIGPTAFVARSVRSDEIPEVRDFALAVLGDYIGNQSREGYEVEPEQVVAAMRLGSPGPYQKGTLLLCNPSGGGICVAKLAVGTHANERVIAEAENLRRVGLYISPFFGWSAVPRVLFEGEYRAGARYLVTDVAASMGTGNSFTKQHRNFLSVLGRHSMKIENYAGSGEIMRIQNHLELIDRLHPKWHAMPLLKRGFDLLGSCFLNKIPLVIAHRDFVPWNVRWSSEGVYAYDWEYCEDGCSPLYDLFHFLLFPRILLGFPVSRIFVRSLIRNAEDYYVNTYGTTGNVSAISRLLLLSYIIDLIGFYYVNSGGSMASKVGARYIRLLEWYSREDLTTGL